MFKANLEIHLMPQQVVMVRSRHFFSRGGDKNTIKTRAGEKAHDPLLWALDACRDFLAHERGHADLHIVFSDLWARYDMIRLNDAEMDDKDAMALAHAQFSRHYPLADSAFWPLRISRQKDQMLVAGINPQLLSSITQMADAAGSRLASVEPLFSKVFDRHEKELAKHGGWVLLDEPGMLIAAFMEHGQLFSIHCQQIDEGGREKAALLLLERQAALISRPAGKTRVFSYSGAQLVLPEPWHGGHFYTIGHTGNAQ